MKIRRTANNFLVLLLVLMMMIMMLFITPVLAGTVEYTYDELHRLVSAEKPDEYRIEYTYDPAGNRIAKVIQLSAPSFDYDGDNDVDGSDLAHFCNEWDGSLQKIHDFAVVFGGL